MLTYHRVDAPTADPWQLSVTPENFRAQLERLRARGFALFGMAEVARLSTARDLPRRAAVITFDDGYADNLDIALPILAAHDAPATVFVTAGQVESGREFWWDGLTRVLLETPDLPDRFEDARIGEPVSLGGESLLHDASLRRLGGWTRWEAPPSRRHAAYVDLWQRLSTLEPDTRESVVDGLRRWAGVAATPDSLRRPVTGDELLRLAAGPGVEIGGHTWTHTPLAGLPEQTQRREIGDTARWLEARIGAPVRGCSHPHGSCDETTRAAVREAGHRYALAGGSGVVDAGTDLLAAPRLKVNDWDAGRFDAFLSHWFGPD